MGNRTGTAVLRATTNSGQYADIRRGNGVVVRSGMSAAFALPLPTSPPGSPPIGEHPSPPHFSLYSKGSVLQSFQTLLASHSGSCTAYAHRKQPDAFLTLLFALT